MAVSSSPDVHLAPAGRRDGLVLAGSEHAHPGTLGRLEPDRGPWPGRTVTAGGVAMHVRETPHAGGGTDAPEAVYVHGLAGSSTNWTDLAGLLSTRVSGVAVDLPGFGRSEPTRSRTYDPAALTDALLCWLAGRREERGPVHLVGNSLGGLIAMNVAARHPELVRSLTLVSPAMPDRRLDPRRMSDPRMALAMVPGLGRSARRALDAEPARARAERVLALCFADPARGSARRLDELVAETDERRTLPWAAEAVDGATRGLLGVWAGRSAWSTASRTTVPTLVVWGAQDRIVTSRLARRTARTLPDGRLLVLPGVGHVAQMEAPEAVARAVAGAWDAQDARRWSRSGS